MKSVGIIANPASGKDIRRLVAHASVFDNHEKAHILQRLLLALDAIGVERVLYMPDYYGLVERAACDLHISLDVVEVPMDVWADERDSTHAARFFCEHDVGCILTVGGDGTNRAVAKGCGSIPLVAISTGTNNVFPNMVESTVAGLAAGLVARGLVDLEAASYRAKQLEVYVDGELRDLALVDVAASSDLFVASRALWDPARIREIVLAQAEPYNLGMSSIGGILRTVGAHDPFGMYLRVGEGGVRILAPVSPGLVIPVPIREHRLFALGEEVAFEPADCTIAVDGERQLEVRAQDTVRVRLSGEGPRVVDVRECLRQASEGGLFVEGETFLMGNSAGQPGRS
jgi:predicted polyphosphate/ATP-dependent NAD kinase